MFRKLPFGGVLVSLVRKRWFFLFVACVINLFAGSIYAWSVFAAPLAERIGENTGLSLTAGDLAVAFSLANGLAPLPMIFGGAVNDKFGPRFVIGGGGLLMGLGLWLAGHAQSVAELTLFYGIFFGLGLGLVYGSTISTTLKFFSDRRGLAGGLTTAAYGISSVLVPSVAAGWIDAYGIATALEIVGWSVGCVIVLGGLLLRPCPADFVPPKVELTAQVVTDAFEQRDWRGMVRSREFFPMIVLLTCGATAGMMVISQGFTIARTQMEFDVSAASLAVSFVALANTFGRLSAGAASDCFGRVRTLGAGLAVAVAGLMMLSLATRDSVALFYAGLLSLGFSFGCFMGVYPGFTAQVFGTRNNSVNFGIMFIGFSVAGVLGPTLMRSLTSMGLPMTYCYASAAVISLLGFAAMALYCHVLRHEQGEQHAKA